MELSFDTLDTPALTKAQLSGVSFDQLGLKKREANDFIDPFFDMLFRGSRRKNFWIWKLRNP